MKNTKLSTKDSVTVKFMEKAIENINTCLAGQYTLYKLLIEKGLITESELISRIKGSKNLPQRKRGSQILQEMLSPNWGGMINFEETEKELHKKSLQKIDELVIPLCWEEEGVKSPNSFAKKCASHTCIKIYNKYKLIPDVVTCTKENGIYLSFKSGVRNLAIEIYNDGGVASVVSNNVEKKILHSEDIENLQFGTCVKIFLNNK